MHSFDIFYFEQVEQTIELLVIWEAAITHVMPL